MFASFQVLTLLKPTEELFDKYSGYLSEEAVPNGDHPFFEMFIGVEKNRFESVFDVFLNGN